VRLEQRASWFPLLVFAAATFAAAPFDRYGRRSANCTSIDGGGHVCTAYSAFALWYWPVALLLSYVAISWFYLNRSRRRGLGTRAQPYVIVGVVLVLLITGFGLWALAHPALRSEVVGAHVQSTTQIANYIYRIASPAGAIGVAMLLLARIERSWVLLAVTAGYLIVVLAPLNTRVGPPSPWSFLPHLLVDGGVLLVGGLLLALIQRAPRRSAE
jgi:hypothetical protein